MTPTPEDIALADSIARIIAIHRENGEAIFDLDISRRLPDLPAAWKAAYLIAAHTAPLRELAEIGRLAVEYEQLQRDDSASADKMDAHYVAYLNALRAYLAKQEESK